MKRFKWVFAAITVIAIGSAFINKPKSTTGMITYPVISGNPTTTYIYVDVNNTVNPNDKGITYWCTSSGEDIYCTITIDPVWVDGQGRVLGTQSYHGLIDYTGRFTQ